MLRSVCGVDRVRRSRRSGRLWLDGRSRDESRNLEDREPTLDSSDGSLAALTAEVRRLRIAVEDLARTQTEAQALAMRVTAQQSRMAQVAEELNAVRKEVESATAHNQGVEGRLAILSFELSNTTERDARAALDDQSALSRPSKPVSISSCSGPGSRETAVSGAPARRDGVERFDFPYRASDGVVALRESVTHTGGCHCGRVRFEVIAPARIEVTDCDCSICSKSGYLHLIVPKSRFKLLSGAETLTTYEFNTKTAKHLFCSSAASRRSTCRARIRTVTASTRAVSTKEPSSR